MAAELINGWMATEPDAWLTMEQACLAYGVSARTLKRRIAAGDVRAKIADGACIVHVGPEHRRRATSASVEPRRRRRASA